MVDRYCQRADVERETIRLKPMRHALVYILLLTAILGVKAQEDPEYRMEVGAGVGLVNYLGDYNGSLVKDLQPMGSLLAKYRPNPRMAWALNASYGTLKGTIADAGTWYPDEQQLPATFSNGLIDACVRYEYNFWAYGTGKEYRGARRVVPFVAVGLGMTYANAPGGAFAVNLPIGAGVKYKIGGRLNLNAEWMMHFTGSDMLDGVADPYGISSSGLFKNTDCYSALQVSLTYDIWAKCKTCNNDRD